MEPLKFKNLCQISLLQSLVKDQFSDILVVVRGSHRHVKTRDWFPFFPFF